MLTRVNKKSFLDGGGGDAKLTVCNSFVQV